MKKGILLFWVSVFVWGLSSLATADEGKKEWTFLVYINGHNNLDSYGAKDINEMEVVGSTSDVNVVVQYATYTRPTTTRLLVHKDSNTNAVTSPTVEDLGKRVDMGNYQTLIDFIKWGAQKYPAKHYFVSVWDHGSGWHLTQDPMNRDISWDDIYRTHITTEQFGLAIRTAAEAIGQPIDIVGSDACLMAMPEIAGEMAKAVKVFVGSEELEPGPGWPYDGLLKNWVADPQASPEKVANILTREYAKSYNNGSQGSSEVTLSAFDMAAYADFTSSLKAFSQEVVSLSATDRAKLLGAAKTTLNFYYSDYRDLGDFLKKISALDIAWPSNSVSQLSSQIKKFVVANDTTGTEYQAASGISIWIPISGSSYASYSARYKKLSFDQLTDWSSALNSLY